MGAAKIRVLVVDDSALVRSLLSELLPADGSIEVVGTAQDPYEAREKIKLLNPDVLTLDVEMPKMDGVTFLRHLMRLKPMPVVMVSSLTERGADITISALQLGAIDFVTKPKLDVAEGLRAYAKQLIEKVKAASIAKVRALSASSAAAQAVRQRPPIAQKTTARLIAIGASTGGTEAIATVLRAFPPDSPGVVIVQHIPEVFSTRFAQRLDGECSIRVVEATDGAPVLIGHAYVAPGNFQLRIERSGARYHCRVTDEPPVNRHRPSVDVLFDSVAAQVGPNAVGALLTGMGADGADGLGRMRKAGAHTVAQDEGTSIVWGMPGEAVRRGSSSEVLPLEDIAARLIELSRKNT